MIRRTNIDSIHFFSFLFLLVAVPFSITSYLYNQSDLPKYSVLIILGSIFGILTLIISVNTLFKASRKSGEIVFEFDTAFDPFVLLFLIAAVLSTVFSLNPEVSYQGQYERQIGLVTYIYLFLIYLFSSNIFSNEERLKQTIFVIEIVAIVVAMYAIIQNSGWDPFGIQPAADKRPVSTLGNSVFAGGFMAMVLPFSFLNASNKKEAILKILFPLIILLGIIVTRTRSAYLAVIIQFILVAVLYFPVFRRSGNEFRKKYKYVIIIIVSLFAIILLFFVFFPNNMYVSRLTSVIFSSNNPRWILWQDAFNVFKKYPITGPGIAMFPSAFEEFYSVRLRFEDVLRYADNPHNNFFQVLYTMGVLGLSAYLLIIVQVLRVCFKRILGKETRERKVTGEKVKSENRKNPALFLSFLAMIAGYCVYGLTNFDEITILLYFFVFLSMLRGINREGQRKLKIKLHYRVPLLVLSLILVSFMCFNIYNSVNAIQADRYFLEGERNFASRKYSEGVSNVNEAIRLADSNPVYKMMLAINVYDMIIANKQISGENRINLLKQAADNIIKAQRNYYNQNRCNAVLSLIYFELGRNEEAERIKNEVLSGDPVNIDYRLGLTVHYVEANEITSAKEQLDAVFSTNYNSLKVWKVAAYYFERTNNIEEAKKYCIKILEAEPQNREAKLFLNTHK